ncbi:MAG TPA: threonine/serine exporter family protein [Gemmatimonadales bacterium]|nr:threonine/serine exporter family protein [Gemmatimonadales bacterium]
MHLLSQPHTGDWPIPSPLDPDPQAAIGFVLRLGEALHATGYASHRIETVMEKVSGQLGLQGQFFATPTSIFAAFGPLERQRTHLLRIGAANDDLGRLADLDEVVGRVMKGELSPADGSAQIDRIMTAPPRYRALLVVLSFGLLSASGARFLGGGALEIAAAAGIGLMVGLLDRLASRVAPLGRVFVPLAAFLAALTAGLLSEWLSGLTVFLVTLAGLIVLLPGWTLTLGMTELATRHLLAGMARLSGAFILLISIVVGMAVGLKAATAIVGAIPAGAPVPLAKWTLYLALVGLPLGAAFLLQVKGRDIPWVMASGIVAFLGGQLGARLLGPELGAFFAALLVGLASNVYAWFTDRPTSVTLVPGVLLLVPGSIGFRGIASMLDRKTLSGVETAFTAVLIAAALTAGILTATVLGPQRRRYAKDAFAS